MQHLIAKLHLRQNQGESNSSMSTSSFPPPENFSDVTFKLPDGSNVSSHRLILAIASPFFEAQFYGRAEEPEASIN